MKHSRCLVNIKRILEPRHFNEGTPLWLCLPLQHPLEHQGYCFLVNLSRAGNNRREPGNGILRKILRIWKIYSCDTLSNAV